MTGYEFFYGAGCGGNLDGKKIVEICRGTSYSHGKNKAHTKKEVCMIIV
jgi:hypothetical protein